MLIIGQFCWILRSRILSPILVGALTNYHQLSTHAASAERGTRYPTMVTPGNERGTDHIPMRKLLLWDGPRFGVSRRVKEEKGRPYL
jgi:hypothetical protein